MKDGLFEKFWDNGQLRSKLNWKRGIIDGIQEYYDDNGLLSYIEKYKDEKLVEYWSYDENGNPIYWQTKEEDYQEEINKRNEEKERLQKERKI